jgi:hypothetical protein
MHLNQYTELVILSMETEDFSFQSRSSLEIFQKNNNRA